MLLADAELLGKQLIQAHVPGWTLGFDNSVRRFGICYYKTKHISLSSHLVALNNSIDVRDVVLHEIAHAIAGYKAGHGSLWRQVAQRLGCTSTRCYGSHVVVPVGKWIAMCPNCSKVFRRVRPPHRARSCGSCSPTYDARFALNYVKL